MIDEGVARAYGNFSHHPANPPSVSCPSQQIKLRADRIMFGKHYLRQVWCFLGLNLLAEMTHLNGYCKAQMRHPYEDWLGLSVFVTFAGAGSV